MEILLSFAGCLALLIGIVVVILLVVWILRFNTQDSKKYNKQKQEKAGVSTPAFYLAVT